MVRSKRGEAIVLNPEFMPLNKRDRICKALLIWCAKKLCTLSKGSCKVVEINAKGALQVGEDSVTRAKG